MGLKVLRLLEVVGVASGYWPLWTARRALVGTSLVGAHRWALLALAGWVAVAGAESLPAAPWTMSPLRYSAAALSVCPIMAVLGARRPGVGAWHFVVLVLLLVLQVPLLQALLRERWDRPLRTDDLWSLLFAGVLLVGTMNYVPTRLGPGLCVIGAFLAAIVASTSSWQAVRDLVVARWGARLAPVGVTAGIWLGWWTWRRGRRHPAGRSWNGIWFEYRERFGLIWSWRVQERFNASAAQLGWPVRLSWRGFVMPAEREHDVLPAESALNVPGPMQTALRSLLRRFVSDAWIAERLEVPPDSRNG